MRSTWSTTHPYPSFENPNISCYNKFFIQVVWVDKPTQNQWRLAQNSFVDCMKKINPKNRNWIALQSTPLTKTPLKSFCEAQTHSYQSVHRI